MDRRGNSPAVPAVQNALQGRHFTQGKIIRKIRLLPCLVLLGASLGVWANPIPVPLPAEMPLEDMEIEISRAGDALRATFTGEFTFTYIPPEVVSMLFPVPPDSVAIRVWQSDVDLSWSWSEEAYPTILPETPTIPMIEWQGLFPEDGAVFRVDYEHNLLERPGEFIFFYALGTGKYFPTYEKTTTANFHILLPDGFDVNGVWLDEEPHSYALKGRHLTLTVQSMFGPIVHDLIVSLVPVGPKALYVATTGDDISGDGSETHPFATIQKAIDTADEGDEVVVMPGTYTGDGNRDIDFKGKAITVRSTDPNDAAVVAATTIDSGGEEGANHRGFDFHSAEGRDSILEGLTITGGLAGTGAGIYCSGASPTIRRNVITGNRVSYDADGGAGIGCWRGASPLIVGNTIEQNHCEPGGGGGGIRCYDAGEPVISHNLIRGNSASQGAGLCIDFCSPVICHCTLIDNAANCMAGGLLVGRDVTLEDCVFVNNRAPSGGGVYNYRCDPVFVRCHFSGNAAEYSGGAIFNTDGCVTTLRGCVLTGNTAQESGGAIYCHAYDGTYQLDCTSCTFSGNRSPLGRALACQTHLWVGPQGVRLANCILWDGGSEIWTDRTAAMLVTHCDVQGGWPGDGNIDSDPGFADAEDGDYHLNSQAGRWDATAEQWVTDNVTSPCIDAGDPASPIGHEPFPNGGRINMGAYGATAQASKSYFGGPPCQTIIAGDVNGDCVVDLADVAIVALHWLTDERTPAMQYEVGPCTMDGDGPGHGELRFSVEVEGHFIHLADVIRGNCCSDFFELQMDLDGGEITAHEIEHYTALCDCMCNYYTNAVLGPFAPGTYTLSVIQHFDDTETLIGTVEVTIE